MNRDHLVNNYINNLGQRLLSATPHAPHTFTFFVIDNPQINAFATFGGYIGIYSGLIRAATTESELGSVIAHEIAHVTQDHLRRSIEKSSNMEVPTTVALLAAILLGGDAPELAEATIATVIAGQQQQQLSFSRDHEREADRLGIERLSSANFNPEAMAHFFNLIREKSRYGTAYPEYLLTHPVTTERISEALDRARQLPKIKNERDVEFLAIQARLTLSHTKDSGQLIKRLSSKKDIKSRYTTILALLENRQHREALEIIKILLAKFPNVLSFQMTEAKIYQAMKSWKLAENSYLAILNISPYNRLVTRALADHYLLRNDYKNGAEILLRLSQHSPLKASELRLLATIANAQGNKAEMYLNQGEAFILEGRYSQALKVLLLAQKTAAGSFYLTNRIDARIDEIRSKSGLKKQQKNKQTNRSY
ncbi:MAG: M48 family metalloprotease [Gammaproteobacteria bacterium]|nr:M48 family metalloprotease [Gammaproteobacteria bacterium]